MSKSLLILTNLLLMASGLWILLTWRGRTCRACYKEPPNCRQVPRSTVSLQNLQPEAPAFRPQIVITSKTNSVLELIVYTRLTSNSELRD